MNYQGKTKATLIELLERKDRIIKNLEEDLVRMDQDYVSQDCCEQLIQEAIKRHEADKLQELTKFGPEQNRKFFRVHIGGAA